MDPKKIIIEEIKKKGGWVNAHAHLDRSFSLNNESFRYSNFPLKEKWYLIDEIKRNSTVDIIYERMERSINLMLEQGTQAIGTFIDVDEIIKDKSIYAGERLLQNYGKDIKIKFANQVLKGVIDPVSRYWFDYALNFVDIIGGLPAKDFGREEEHLDFLLSSAKKKNKLVHVHVDQFNIDQEKETELLAKKTIEHKMEGKVTAIHSISIAAHPKKYRSEVYKLIKKANLMIISCPTAWIDHNRTERLTPSHNSITPVDEMIPAGITVAFGTDNINDIYKPFSDGDLWTELRLILESCHYYNINELVKIATINGLKVLGLN